jgi:hypothetical protein
MITAAWRSRTVRTATTMGSTFSVSTVTATRHDSGPRKSPRDGKCASSSTAHPNRFDDDSRMGLMFGSPISQEKTSTTNVVVNVFDGGPRTTVEYRIGRRPPVRMKRESRPLIRATFGIIRVKSGRDAADPRVQHDYEMPQSTANFAFLHQSGSAVEEGDRAVRVQRDCGVIVGDGTIDLALNRIEIAASDIRGCTLRAGDFAWSQGFEKSRAGGYRRLGRCRVAGSDTSLAIDRDCGGLRERGDRNTSWDCKEKCGGKPSERVHGWVRVSFNYRASSAADWVTRGAGFRHVNWWMPHSQAGWSSRRRIYGQQAGRDSRGRRQPARSKDGPTWGPPGGLVLDGREHGGRLMCVGIGRMKTLVVDRGEIPDRRMTAAPVVEALDEIEHAGFLRAGHWPQARRGYVSSERISS